MFCTPVIGTSLLVLCLIVKQLIPDVCINRFMCINWTCMIVRGNLGGVCCDRRSHIVAVQEHRLFIKRFHRMCRQVCCGSGVICENCSM